MSLKAVPEVVPFVYLILFLCHHHKIYSRCRFPPQKLKYQKNLFSERSLRKQNSKGSISISYITYILLVLRKMLQMPLSPSKTKMPNWFIPLMESLKEKPYVVHLCILCFIDSLFRKRFFNTFYS